jgi:hypothetical protein
MKVDEKNIIKALCNKDVKTVGRFFSSSEIRRNNKNFCAFVYKALVYAYNYHMSKDREDEALIYSSFLVELDKPFWTHEVDTYRKLQRSTIGFLKGKIGTTMFHAAPLDNETIPLMNDLVLINQLGFVSMEGQPGICEYNIPGKISDIEQVSYIMGFYYRDKRDSFGRKLAKKGFVATNSEDKEVFAPREYTKNFKIKWGRNRFRGKEKWEEWDHIDIDLAGENIPSQIQFIFNDKLRSWAYDNLDTWTIYDTVECRERLIPTLISILQKLY